MNLPALHADLQEPRKALGTVPPFSQEQIRANHTRLLERNAVHRRFGYDPDASVHFVVKKALPLRGHVLDVGTGKGRFAIPLAREVARVTTVDISAEEQHCALLEALYAGVADRIEFVLADARSLSWRTGSFDVVTSWNVFHHLDEPERVFNEMVRVLKPGGKLVLADFSPSGFRLMDEIHAAEGKRHPHPPSRFPHWRARLQNLGFQVRRLADHHQEVLVAKHRPYFAPFDFPHDETKTSQPERKKHEQRKTDQRTERRLGRRTRHGHTLHLPSRKMLRTVGR